MGHGTSHTDPHRPVKPVPVSAEDGDPSQGLLIAAEEAGEPSCTVWPQRAKHREQQPRLRSPRIPPRCCCCSSPALHPTAETLHLSSSPSTQTCQLFEHARGFKGGWHVPVCLICLLKLTVKPLEIQLECLRELKRGGESPDAVAQRVSRL